MPTTFGFPVQMKDEQTTLGECLFRAVALGAKFGTPTRIRNYCCVNRFARQIDLEVMPSCGVLYPMVFSQFLDEVDFMTDHVKALLKIAKNFRRAIYFEMKSVEETLRAYLGIEDWALD